MGSDPTVGGTTVGPDMYSWHHNRELHLELKCQTVK